MADNTNLDDRGPPLVIVSAVFVAVAFVTALARFYTRAVIVKSFGTDDWAMLFALLFHIMHAACAIAGVHYGTGRHFSALSPYDIFMAMRFWWICYIAYCLAMISAKISIAYFLLRITVRRLDRWIIYTVMVTTVTTGIVFFFIAVFQCSPVSYFWNRDQSGKCINVEVIVVIVYVYSAISAICDFTFGILPGFLVWNLNMSLRLKLAVIPILSLGCVASTAVIVRMVYVTEFYNSDFLYATVDIAIWSAIEQALAITAGSLATLRPLYRRLRGRHRESTKKTPTSSGGEGGNKYNSRDKNRSGSNRRRNQFSLMTLTQYDQNEEQYTTVKNGAVSDPNRDPSAEMKSTVIPMPPPSGAAPSLNGDTIEHTREDKAGPLHHVDEREIDSRSEEYDDDGRSRTSRPDVESRLSPQPRSWLNS